LTSISTIFIALQKIIDLFGKPPCNYHPRQEISAYGSTRLTLSCRPASDCGPEANPLRLMKDRQTGLMKKFPEKYGKIIRDRV
jgi:hypothetical protein